MESLKFYFFLLASLGLTLGLFAQPTYILFDQSCMERLSYDQSSPDTRQAYVAYHINLRSGEKLILDVGEESGKEQNYVPEPYLSCNTGGIDKTLITRINTNRNQVFVVYPKNNRTYVVSPVTMASLYQKQGNIITYQSPKYQFRFDTDYGTIGENIALNNPGVKIYFEGKLTNDCAGAFLFRQLAPSSTYPLIDLVLMPEIGIVEERAGANASAAMDNALVLEEVNGTSRDRYLREVCGMEPGARGALTTRQVPTTPTSFNTAATNFNPPVAGNLPPGAIVPGGQTSSLATARTPLSTSTGGIPNQLTPAASTPATTAPAPAATTTTHTVASGETLYGISREYGVSVKEIKEWNNLNSNTIRRGQVLMVAAPSAAAQEAANTASSTSPALAARSGSSQATTLTGTPVPYQDQGGRIATGEMVETHLVQPGETVASIALTYGYTARRFREINGLGPNDYVKVGQRLKVSDCDCPPETTMGSATSTAAPSPASSMTPNSYGSTGGRISPNTFTTRSSQNSYPAPVVSPGETFTPVRNAGGLIPRDASTPSAPAANVYNTILPTGYDRAPAQYDALPTAYDTPDTRPRSPAATTMGTLESSPRMISSGNTNSFGETPIVPADPRPQDYTFTPSSPYPIPSASNTTYRTPTAAASPRNNYVAPSSAIPDSYNMPASSRINASSNNQGRVHVVHEGESLYGIAKQYGISVAQIRRLNQLEPGDIIKPDQRLYVE